MTKGDKKWVEKAIVDNVTEALEKVVIPQFERLDGRIDQLDGRIDQVEINLGRRLDKLAEVVTEVKTDHERRIVRLEKGVGLAI